MIARHYVIAHVMDVMLFWEFHIFNRQTRRKIDQKIWYDFSLIKAVVFSIPFLYFFCRSELFCLYHWRASKVSETPSIATYQKKVVYIRTSKLQCACSQFYVMRRSGHACIYVKPACCSRVQL